jgi:ABC-type glutathione transport system ATPase component
MTGPGGWASRHLTVGESGCGKSTVARAIVGLVPISGGRLLLDGQDLLDQEPRHATRRRQMIFQDPYSSPNPRMSIGEMLDEALAGERLTVRRTAE